MWGTGLASLAKWAHIWGAATQLLYERNQLCTGHYGLTAGFQPEQHLGPRVQCCLYRPVLAAWWARLGVISQVRFLLLLLLRCCCPCRTNTSTDQHPSPGVKIEMYPAPGTPGSPGSPSPVGMAQVTKAPDGYPSPGANYGQAPMSPDEYKAQSFQLAQAYKKQIKDHAKKVGGMGGWSLPQGPSICCASASLYTVPCLLPRWHSSALGADVRWSGACLRAPPAHGHMNMSQNAMAHAAYACTPAACMNAAAHQHPPRSAHTHA